MKKIALLFVIFVFSSVSASAQTAEILKRMEQHQKALKSFQANITINKFSVQFGGNYTKEGDIKYLSQSNDYSLRMDSTKPLPESFLIVKNQYLLYLPNLKTEYTGTTTDQQKSMFMIFSNLSKKNLINNYLIKYIGEERVNGKNPAWHPELKPKKPNSYKTIELWVDGNGMPLQSKITETSGDSTNVLLTNLKKNITMKSADFEIPLPNDIQIIKD